MARKKEKWSIERVKDLLDEGREVSKEVRREEGGPCAAKDEPTGRLCLACGNEIVQEVRSVSRPFNISSDVIGQPIPRDTFVHLVCEGCGLLYERLGPFLPFKHSNEGEEHTEV